MPVVEDGVDHLIVNRVLNEPTAKLVRRYAAP